MASASHDLAGRAVGRRGWTTPGLTRDGAIFASRAQRFAPFFVEALGVFILTLTFAYNYRNSNGALWAVTSNGLMLMALTYAFAHISGANLNPSISLSLLMAGRQRGSVMWLLCVAQFSGAFAAALVLSQLTHTDSIDLGPRPGHSWGAVMGVEFVYSAVLCFVYLNCAASTRNNPWQAPNGFIGLAVGFTFVAGGYAARAVAPVVMNSAIAVGLTFFDGKGGAANVCYFLADFAGAFVAAGAYRLVRPSEADRSDDIEAMARQAAQRGAGPAARPQEKRRQREADADSAARVAAEFFGTFVVVYTKALNRLDATVDIGPEAWSVAAALTSMVYSLGGVSGAYFNPAVTLAAKLSGRANLSTRTTIFYVLAQLVAGIAATSLFLTLSHGKPITLQFGRRVPTEAELYAESCYTFLVTYVVLATSLHTGRGSEALAIDDDSGKRFWRQSDIAGFAYGACQVAGGFAVGHISGALLNPAVVIAFEGVNIFSNHFRGRVLLYIVWETLGALLATGTFMVTNAHLYLHDPEEAAQAASSA